MISSISSGSSSTTPTATASATPAAPAVAVSAASPRSEAAAGESTVVTISAQAADESQARAMLDSAYEPADANQDGKVTEFERRAYDLEHPETAEQDAEPAPRSEQRAGLDTYAAVARGG